MLRIDIEKELPPARQTTALTLDERFIRLLQSIERALNHETNFLLDLSVAPWLDVGEIITLALWCRRLATLNRSVTIRLPNDPKSPLAVTLANLRFSQRLQSSSEWCRKISIEGRSLRLDEPTLSPKKKLLPISWIDLSTFGVAANTTDAFYRVDPNLSKEYTRFVNDLLLTRGFIHPSSVDDFVRGILREIGWNSVLHSASHAGEGLAVFGGQVLQKPEGTCLEFVLVDAGKGIASTLKTAYHTARRRKQMPDYEREYGCGLDAAIVRFAFDRQSTSRSIFPSEYDALADRGLSLVAEVARESGKVSLVSSRARVTTKRNEARQYDVSDLEAPFLGTYVSGSLLPLFEPVSRSNPNTESYGLEKVIEKLDVYSIAPMLQAFPERGLDHWRQFLRKMRRTEHIAIDFGFHDTGLRWAENVLVIFIETLRPKNIVVMNLRSRGISIGRISNVLSQRNRTHDVELWVIDTSASSVQANISSRNAGSTQQVSVSRYLAVYLQSFLTRQQVLTFRSDSDFSIPSMAFTTEKFIKQTEIELRTTFLL